MIEAHCLVIRLIQLCYILDASLPAIKLACGGDRNSLWCKTQEAFKYIYAKHGFGNFKVT